MKVCPRCGKNEREVPFIGFFCRECYLELNPPVEERTLEVKVCPTCGRMFLGKWTEPRLDSLTKWISRHVKASPDVTHPSITIAVTNEDETSFTFRGILTGVIGGTPLQYRFAGVVRKVKEQCPVCARRAGGYYEAVLQLRGKRWEELYRRVIDQLTREKDPKAFIAKEIPRKNGIDILLGSKKVAEKIGRRMRNIGATMKISHTLVTERDGRPITREYVALRLD